MAELGQIKEALIKCDEATLTALVKEAMGQGIAAKEILNDGLIAGMDVIGERMETGEMFIPEVLMSANVMASAVAILKPELAAAGVTATGKVVFGTVKGDLHDIGKNLVIMMLESAGFDVIDLGTDVEPEKFAAAVAENRPNLVGLSALLTTTMGMIRTTIEALREQGLRDQVKIMVGGAPINRKFAEDVGADGYAPDAGSAARLAKSLAL
jgi:5-methyltetrahydrofolate--homocysteine methyltransferase